MKTFSDIGVNEEIVRILEGIGFKYPTPIQEEAIPLVLEGKDIIGQAETGSGKTAACGIPIVQMIDKSLDAPQAIVLTPTRELAIQYLEEISSIGTPYGVKPFVIYGGFDMDIQMTKLKDGVHVIVATPGRLADIIYNQQFPLSHIKTFVIDEADEMLKMGFIEDVSFIKKCVVREHQTLLFSATMPGPIKKLAGNYMKDAVHIRLNKERIQPDKLTHSVIRVHQSGKEKALKEFLQKEEISQAIIFCNTRRRVEQLYKKIKGSVSNAEYIHGGLPQGKRTSLMGRFRKRKIRFMVTTDVMARGMDISGVSHIINYDVTKNPEIYIHRSGRTARMGREGVSVSFVSSREEENYEEIKKRSDLNPDRKKHSRYSKRSFPGKKRGFRRKS